MDLVNNVIAGLAFAVAAVALVLGEVRAARARADLRERNLVDWTLAWIDSGTAELENLGPDPAMDVFVVLNIGAHRAEGQAKQLSRGQVMSIALPEELASAWDRLHPADGVAPAESSGLSVTARISWRTPRQRLDKSSVVDQAFEPVDSPFGTKVD